MYKSNKLLIATFIAASISGCTNLETNEVDSKVEDSQGGGAGKIDPTEGLVAAYKDFGAYTDQANIYALYEQPTDEMIPPTRGVDWSDNGVWRSLHTHTWDPTHSQVLGTWNQLNQRVFRTNQILGSEPTPGQAAEAKFLRAFHMFHVMDLFGQVPYREWNEGVDVNPKVYTRAEAFDFIVKDLTEALPNLPSIGPASTNPKASKAAAYALLARLYLNKAVYTAANPAGPYDFAAADMDKVIEYADLVADEGYSLDTDYFQNFSKYADSEIIFTSAEGTPQNRWFMTLHYNQNPSGWNGFTTLADFYNKFEEDDIRRGVPPTADGSTFSGIGRGFLVGPQVKEDGSALIDTRTQRQLDFTPDVPLSGAATDKGIRVIKYHPSDNGQYILLRYADVYLMKAEAIFRGGSGDVTALEMINDLRDLRGASALGSVTEGDILDERGRELYWEGVRRIDQIRFGTFTDTWSEKTNTEPFRVLFPIPQQAIDSNPNLQQNDGY